MRLLPDYIQHSEHFVTAGQIDVSSLADIKAAGFQTIINNRPDGEGGPSQPLSADLHKKAAELGLHYAYLPVIPGRFSAEQVAAMAEILKTMPKPFFSFCLSGGRSTVLYKLAQELLATE